MDKTEYWIRRGHGKAIALIHGINAEDPQDYWRDFLSVLSSDQQFQDFGIFVWKYPTHVHPGRVRDFFASIRTKTLHGTAPSIRQLGAAWNTTYNSQFRDYQDVFLICHSMGGLVVKSWIVDTLEQKQGIRLETLRHITFYATPHNGAPITTLANWNKQLRDMQITSPFIEEVGKRWNEHVVAWKDKVLAAEEHPSNRYIPHLVIVGLSDDTVPPSASRIKDMPLETIQGNHFEVIQPQDTKDTRYTVWSDALNDLIQAKPQSTPSDYHTCVLSYATDDKAFAEKLYIDLKQKGVTCWFAPYDLKPGDKLRTRIYEKIRKNNKLLLILSEHAVTSDWVEREVELAFERESQPSKPLVLFPIRLDDAVMRTEAPWAGDIRRIRFIGDFTQWQNEQAYQGALQRLLHDLQA
jgi:TIR domain/PGAP1-like protein